jgi:hypothetical protein
MFIKERRKDKKYHIYNNKTSKIKAENKWKKKNREKRIHKDYTWFVRGLKGTKRRETQRVGHSQRFPNSHIGGKEKGFRRRQ